MKITATVTVEDHDCSPHYRAGPIRPFLTWKVPRESRATPPRTPQFARPYLKGEALMATQLTATQQVDVAAAPKDRRGNPATVQDPTWLTDNSDVLSLVPSADGLTCTVTATGIITQPGAPARLQFNADADLGSGVVPIIGTLEVDVVAGTATVVALTPGTPTEQS